MNVGERLTSKLGPFPVWVWGVIVSGAWVITRMVRGGGTATTGVSEPILTAQGRLAEDILGMGGIGGGANGEESLDSVVSPTTQETAYVMRSDPYSGQSIMMPVTPGPGTTVSQVPTPIPLPPTPIPLPVVLPAPIIPPNPGPLPAPTPIVAPVIVSQPRVAPTPTPVRVAATPARTPTAPSRIYEPPVRPPAPKPVPRTPAPPPPQVRTRPIPI